MWGGGYPRIRTVFFDIVHPLLNTSFDLITVSTHKVITVNSTQVYTGI